MKLKFTVNKDRPSFAISRIEEAITLKGRAWATGWISAGKDEIGKNTPERQGFIIKNLKKSVFTNHILVDKENLLKMARANAVYSGIRR